MKFSFKKRLKVCLANMGNAVSSIFDDNSSYVYDSKCKKSRYDQFEENRDKIKDFIRSYNEIIR